MTWTRIPVGVSWGCPVEAPPTGQESVLPESQRLDIQGQLAGRAPSVAARGILSQAVPPRRPPPGSGGLPRSLAFPRVPSPNLPFSQGHRPSWTRATPVTSLELGHLGKDSVPK